MALNTFLSVLNSSTSPLAGGATFTGVAESARNYVSLILTAKTDVDGTIFVDFSPDGTNWDRIVPFTLQANTSELHHLILINAYFRVRVVNGSSAQSFLRLQSILGPYLEPTLTLNAPATVLQPDTGAVVNRSLLFGSPLYNNIRADAVGAMLTSTSQVIAGKSIAGTTVEPNFWTTTETNGGTVTQATGSFRIRTNTTANGLASLSSRKYARFMIGRPNIFIGNIALSHSGTANNITEWGVGTANDRLVFRLSSTTLYCVVRNNGTDIVNVASTSWSRNRTAPTLTNVNTYEIQYSSDTVHFIINDVVVHVATLIGQSTYYGLVSTASLPILLSNTNSGDSTTDLSMYASGVSVTGSGVYASVPLSANIITATTTVLKRSTGILHSINLNTAQVGAIKLYDDVSATNIFASIAVSNSDLPITWLFNAAFNLGLTIVTSSAVDITVSYE